jgi:hypothetical protein
VRTQRGEDDMMDKQTTNSTIGKQWMNEETFFSFKLTRENERFKSVLRLMFSSSSSTAFRVRVDPASEWHLRDKNERRSRKTGGSA